MTTRDVITRAQLALHEQDAAGNREVIRRLDDLATALGHVEDIKRSVDRLAGVVTALGETHSREENT